MEKKAIGEQENKRDLNSTTKYRNDLSERDRTSFLNHPGYLSLKNWKELPSEGPMSIFHGSYITKSSSQKETQKAPLPAGTRSCRECEVSLILSDQGFSSGQARSLPRPDPVLLGRCFFHKKKKIVGLAELYDFSFPPFLFLVLC